MDIEEYLLQEFPDLKLIPPLFNHWGTGIRFKLGVNFGSLNTFAYLQNVYDRVLTLFQFLHFPTDEIYLVVEVDSDKDVTMVRRKLNIYSRYVKDKKILYRLNQKVLPYIFPEDDEERELVTNRYTLKCHVSDLRYIPMLKAVCNKDLGIRPKLDSRVYIINKSRNTIFYVYDDQICDLLATTSETIVKVNDRFKKWVITGIENS